MVEERLFDWEGDSDLSDLSIVVPILWLGDICRSLSGAMHFTGLVDT